MYIVIEQLEKYWNDFHISTPLYQMSYRVCLNDSNVLNETTVSQKHYVNTDLMITQTTYLVLRSQAVYVNIFCLKHCRFPSGHWNTHLLGYKHDRNENNLHKACLRLK